MEEDTLIDPGYYLCSLIKNRYYLIGMSQMADSTTLIEKIDKVIDLELDLAIMAAEKAKSELIKRNKNNIKPINPDNTTL